MAYPKRSQARRYAGWSRGRRIVLPITALRKLRTGQLVACKFLYQSGLAERHAAGAVPFKAKLWERVGGLYAFCGITPPIWVG